MSAAKKKSSKNKSFVSKHKWEIIVFVLIAFGGSAIISTVLIAINLKQNAVYEKEIGKRLALQKSQKLSLNKLYFKDFMIPDEYKGIKKDTTEVFRVRLNQWSQEQIDPFMTDPQNIGVEYFAAQNQVQIDQLFEGVQ